MNIKALFCCLAVGVLVGCNSGFSDEDIRNVEASIRTNFEKEDFTVVEVKMIKESDRKLSGFAKVKKTMPLLGEMQVSKACTATMAEDSTQYIWRCE